jgi:hypothetical protein
VEKEILEVMKEKPDNDASRGKRSVDCCCPSFILFIFKEINCAQIFNGACEDWRPGSPCVKNVYK